MIFLGLVANAINYIDPANLAAAAPSVREQLDIDAATMGDIVPLVRGQSRRTHFSAHRNLLVVDFYRADCRRPQRSRISRLPASPGNWRDWRLSFLREGDCGLVSAKRAGLACGLFDSGSRIGSALSIPLVSWLISSFGRRESFLVTSVLGFIWAIFRIWLCRDLEAFVRHTRATCLTASRPRSA
jgi:MFS transporter, ACS family, D-galactonate transporter